MDALIRRPSLARQESARHAQGLLRKIKVRTVSPFACELRQSHPKSTFCVGHEHKQTAATAVATAAAVTAVL